MVTPVRPGSAALSAVLAGLAFALVGCSTPAPEPSSGPIASASASVSAEPVFASEEEALAAATKAYERYLEVSDDQFTRGVSDSNAFAEVLVPSLANFESEALAVAIEDGWRQTGRVSIDSVTLQRFSPLAAEGKEVVAIYLCVDLSSVDVVDKDGVSVVTSDQSDRAPFEARFVRSSETRFGMQLASKEPWAGGDFC